jgi:Fur family ferric uptake transcriptional regulator
MAIPDENTVLEKFNGFLKSNGLKPTTERLTILKEALTTDGHFEADDLLVILKKKGQKSSRATVYRTLDIMSQAGVLRKVCLGESAVQFEKINNKPHHDHLICRKCGGKIEFINPEFEQIRRQICSRHNFQPSGYCFQIFGTCSDCAGKSPETADDSEI